MSAIAGISSAAFAVAAKQATPKTEESHGRDRSAEGTAETNKNDKKEAGKVVDIQV